MNSRKRLDFNMESVLNLTSDMEVGSFFYARNQRSSEERDTGKVFDAIISEILSFCSVFQSSKPSDKSWAYRTKVASWSNRDATK